MPTWRRTDEGAGQRVVATVPPRPWRILLAADDPDVSELLARVLATDGHLVRRAVNHQATLVALLNEPADCVVLDLTRAGAGGNLKLLDALRSSEDEHLAGSRVVLCGGRGSNRLFSWESGIDAFLQHPFHARELLDAVAAVVERPEEERRRHRRQQSDRARLEGRSAPAAPAPDQP
ncbi:MAG: hypothetical protein IPM45_10505 [Acidimicrobiales bacterium]|nr:hypothetical protein [Acidimicrobiales bacterium]